MVAKAVYKSPSYGELSKHAKGSPELDVDHIKLTPKEFEDAVQNERRKLAIVRDALLNDILGRLIKSCISPKVPEALEELLSRGGGLEYTNNRARLARALDLIDQKTFQDLKCIHNIRNTFAHLKEPDLSDKKLRENIEKLSVVPKKNQVSEDNYMDFHRRAVEGCLESLINLLDSKEPKPEHKSKKQKK